MAKPLTPKQQKFVDEYLVDRNATQAAIRAGYSEKTAESQGCTLLRNPKVAAAVAAGAKADAEKVGVTREKVLAAIAEVAFGDIRGMFDANGALKRPADWDDATAAAVAGLDVVTVSAGEGAVEHVAKIKRSDRLRALDMLAKHHNLYAERVEVTGKDGGPLEVSDISATEAARHIAFALAKGMRANNGESPE